MLSEDDYNKSGGKDVSLFALSKLGYNWVERIAQAIE